MLVRTLWKTVLLAVLALCVSLVAAPVAGQDGGHADDHADASHAADSHTDSHATDAHAGDDHSGDHDKHGVIGSVAQGTVAGLAAIIVFLLVLGILGTQVWPKIAAGLDEREKKIRDEIEAAEAARLQAKDALNQYEKSLGEARAEAQAMLEATKADQQKLAAELRSKSEADLQAMKEKAQRDIEAARRAAVGEIYAQAADLATAVAGKILSREVNSSDKQRLVDEAVAELGSATNN